MNPIPRQHLLDFKVKKAKVVVKDDYAKGFIKACADKQVEPEKVIEVIELLDIHL